MDHGQTMTLLLQQQEAADDVRRTSRSRTGSTKPMQQSDNGTGAAIQKQVISPSPTWRTVQANKLVAQQQQQQDLLLKTTTQRRRTTNTTSSSGTRHHCRTTGSSSSSSRRGRDNADEGHLAGDCSDNAVLKSPSGSRRNTQELFKKPSHQHLIEQVENFQNYHSSSPPLVPSESSSSASSSSSSRSTTSKTKKSMVNNSSPTTKKTKKKTITYIPPTRTTTTPPPPPSTPQDLTCSSISSFLEAAHDDNGSTFAADDISELFAVMGQDTFSFSPTTLSSKQLVSSSATNETTTAATITITTPTRSSSSSLPHETNSSNSNDLLVSFGDARRHSSSVNKEDRTDAAARNLQQEPPSKTTTNSNRRDAFAATKSAAMENSFAVRQISKKDWIQLNMKHSVAGRLVSNLTNSDLLNALAQNQQTNRRPMLRRSDSDSTLHVPKQQLSQDHHTKQTNVSSGAIINAHARRPSRRTNSPRDADRGSSGGGLDRFLSRRTNASSPPNQCSNKKKNGDVRPNLQRSGSDTTLSVSKTKQLVEEDAAVKLARQVTEDMMKREAKKVAKAKKKQQQLLEQEQMMKQLETEVISRDSNILKLVPVDTTTNTKPSSSSSRTSSSSSHPSIHQTNDINKHNDSSPTTKTKKKKKPISLDDFMEKKEKKKKNAIASIADDNCTKTSKSTMFDDNLTAALEKAKQLNHQEPRNTSSRSSRRHRILANSTDTTNDKNKINYSSSSGRRRIVTASTTY